MEQLKLFWEALQPGSQVPLFFNTVLFAVLFFVLLSLQVAFAGWQRLRLAVLLVFSLGFYFRMSGWVPVPFSEDAQGQPVQVPFVAVLVFTALLGWALALQMARTKHAGMRRALLWCGLGFGLGVLAFFKYAYFAADTALMLAGDWPPDAPLRMLEVVGLSYYTFKTLSYLLDVYNGEIEAPEPNPAYYLLYVSFFPAILAGPIHKARLFLPQLRERYAPARAQVSLAFYLFLVGMVKKVAIADALGVNYVERIFADPALYTGFENLMAAFLFGIQLFADFSGYTDMAIAVALLLGFRLEPNFDEPFKARNVSEFWRRWHITLGAWFHEYVYTPLSFGWRRWGRWGAVLAVVLTFVLSGLWHGPHWTFVLWGTAHGLAIGWETATRNTRARLRKTMPRDAYNGVSLLLTMAFLTATYVLFKADSLAEAGLMYEKIFTDFAPEVVPNWFGEYWRVTVVLAIALALVYVPKAWKSGLEAGFGRLHWTLQAGLAALVVALLHQVASAEAQPFLYLRF